MLEALLVLACLSPNNDSCGKSFDAYQKQSGLEQMIQQYGNKHPTVAFFVGAAGLAREKRLYYGINGPFYHSLQANGNAVEQILWFKKEF